MIYWNLNSKIFALLCDVLIDPIKKVVNACVGIWKSSTAWNFPWNNTNQCYILRIWGINQWITWKRKRNYKTLCSISKLISNIHLTRITMTSTNILFVYCAEITVIYIVNSRYLGESFSALVNGECFLFGKLQNVRQWIRQWKLKIIKIL